MKMLAGVVSVLGRMLICSVFLAAAVGHTSSDVNSLSLAIAAQEALAPTAVLFAAIAWLLIGSLSVIVGFKARFGALALLLFLALTTYLFHGFTFWNIANSQARQDHVVYLVLNLSSMGAMLMILANGAGRMSLDGR